MNRAALDAMAALSRVLGSGYVSICTHANGACTIGIQAGSEEQLRALAASIGASAPVDGAAGPYSTLAERGLCITIYLPRAAEQAVAA